ncbi:hypothetical protein M409DRAFT_66305 [Zasmidium cellare ATCC 36951]|uniref:BTB domain-containing protein n=1 Tax=Zasmidium cellare ATCC 36951 TaxID=1080233 RepID=A0A6A6CPB6_ZASCE|nr:uncharacterized protein M409DRAFT_66305 [Zasmidium cellare ATCC 36951]KAF2167306.1 hypothetical protein M409DRAFT_66305 [Zasmidium cellare ATCC 36951]
MPAPNGDAPAVQQAGKMRRTTPNRVVPVIPLMPKASRPQSKQDSKSRTNTATPSSGEGLAGVSNGVDVQKAVDKASQPPEATQSNVLQNGHATHEDQAGSAATQTPDSSTSSGAAGATQEPTNGVTPDASESATRQADLPVRKPVDRFDMRQIRTELPPAFVPAADQHTPQSASSSQTRQQHPILPHAHRTHPSASNIIFGGHDSAGSSPAPPLSSNSAYAPPHPQQAPFFGHAHHGSEPQSQRGYPPGYQQPPAPWQMRPGFAPGMPQPYYHPHAHMPMRYPPREAFMPGAAPLPNGHGLRSRSGSQASSAAHEVQKIGSDLQSPIGTDQSADAARHNFPESKAGFPGHPRHLPPQSQPHMPPPNFGHPEVAINLENAESLRDHVLSQLRNPELADCHLQISEQEGYGRHYLEGHKLILARSSTLLSIIRNSEAPAAATLKTQVHVQLKGNYIRVGPFLDAVRYIYGGPLPPFDMFGAGGAPVEERMELALQHIATGAWLNIAPFAHRGVEVSSSLLNWETIPQALGFALEGGLAQMWPIDDGSEERISTCSSDDSFNKPEAGGSPTYDPYSSGLLHRAIDFTVQQLPPNFYLDSTAPQLEACPRLPPFQPSHESKLSRSDPRLSKIRFGEVPTDDHQRPSFATTTVSSILLSLPFPLLKCLLEHPILSTRLGSETVASIMRQVVNEREVRRQKALKARTDSRVVDGAESTAVQNLYWEELVEPFPQNRAGFRLARRRRGIDTPPSSGNESERTK